MVADPQEFKIPRCGVISGGGRELQVPGSYVVVSTYRNSVPGEAVEDLIDGPSGGFGDRGYPKVCIERPLEDFYDQKVLAVGEPSQVRVELGAHLDIDLLDAAGATTRAAIGIPGFTKYADRCCCCWW